MGKGIWKVVFDKKGTAIVTFKEKADLSVSMRMEIPSSVVKDVLGFTEGEWYFAGKYDFFTKYLNDPSPLKVNVWKKLN